MTDAPTPPTLAQPEVRKMMAMFRAARWPVDAESMHRHLTEFTGRPIKHRNEITHDEAVDLFAMLDDIARDLPPPDPDLVDVHTAMSRVARDIGLRGVGKGGVNQDQHYQFRGIDDIINALSPIFAKHGVLVIPRVRTVDHENRPTRSGGSQLVTTLLVDWTIVGPNGATIEATTVGLGMDTSDKSANKAMTSAFKYLLGQAFAIPLVGFDEADWTSPIRETVAPADANRELLDHLDNFAREAGMDREAFTTKFRSDNGGMTIEQFNVMPRDRLFAFVRSVEEWAARHAPAVANDAGGYG